MKIVHFGISMGVALASSLATADSCYDLWHARNSIYAEYGYCFKTQLGQETFGTQCVTNSPKLTKAEQKFVASIKAQEKAKKCKVN